MLPKSLYPIDKAPKVYKQHECGDTCTKKYDRAKGDTTNGIFAVIQSCECGPRVAGFSVMQRCEGPSMPFQDLLLRLPLGVDAPAGDAPGKLSRIFLYILQLSPFFLFFAFLRS